MTSRRVRNIAARKKQDTLFGVTGPVSSGPDQASIPPGVSFFLHNGTYRLYQDHDNDHVRTTQTPYYVGIKDRVQLSCTFPYTHRRVCFWTHEQILLGQPYNFPDEVDPDENPSYMRRNITQLNPTLSDQAAVLEYLFKGTLNTDYSASTRPITPFDSKRVVVVYDKTFQINPHIGVADPSASFGGKIVNRRFWHPIRKTISYDEDEDGAAVGPQQPGYASRNPRYPGNFYIMDIFSTGQNIENPEGTVGTFTPETTTYWHET